jgi:hypothetical protein
MFIPQEKMAASTQRLRMVIASGSAPLKARKLASILGDIAWSANIVQILKLRIYAVWSSLGQRVAQTGWNCKLRLSQSDMAALKQALIIIEACVRQPTRFTRPLKFELSYDLPTAWSDASGTGAGVVIADVGFWQGRWLDPASLLSDVGAVLMPLMEAYGLAAAVDLCIALGAVRDGGALVVGIDSQCVLGAVLKGRSTSPRIHSVLNNMFSQIAKHSIDLFVAYVHTDSNHADAPSRTFPLHSIQISGAKPLYAIPCWPSLPQIFQR